MLFARYFERKRLLRNDKQYQLIAFDIDGTIAESKASIDPDMAALLCRLLEKRNVALVSGASYVQMMTQIVNLLPCEKSTLKRLWLVPISGAVLYSYTDTGWTCLDNHVFSTEEKESIRAIVTDTLAAIGYVEPEHVYGDIFEDREGQITFSAVGQKAPLSEKLQWQKTSDIRPKLLPLLQEKLPACEVRSGGTTSIDITKKGIDKAFAIENLVRFSGIDIEHITYVGDALYPGGNDEAVKKTSVRTVEVKNPEDTKTLIAGILGDKKTK